MGKQRAAPPPSDNLTISRIHIVLRPFETKLNVLAKTLEKKIAEDKYAPKPRQPGITYAKRHRIRAMTGMTSQQAGRAYALEKSKGLSTLYSFHEQLIGVEDAFRNLLRGIPPLERSEQVARVPSLQAMVCQMIGRQVAEETLRDKEALEADGVEDCIGLWYGGLSVHCRKYALVSHAVQLVELKIPFFILELWKGLLTITMQAGHREESCILLEYILLYYFDPDDTSANDGACPAAHMAGRDLTDLYNQLTDLSVYSLPPGEFFATLLPIIEASPCAVAIWNFRCIHHFIRNLDDDIILTARIVDSMARTWADSLEQPQESTKDVEKLAGAVESKTYGLLTVFATLGDTCQDPEVITEEMVREVAHLAWTTNLVGKSRPSADLLGISLALDVVTILLVTKHSSLAGINLSDAIERLNNIGPLQQQDEEESKEEIYKALVKALHSAQPAPLFAYQKQRAETSSPDSPCSSPKGEKRLEPSSYLAECLNALRVRGVEDLAEKLERCNEEMVSRGDNMRLCIVPAPSGELKRRRMEKEPRGGKRRKLQKDWKDEESVGDETTGSESEAATEWSASVSEEDTAGEQQEDDDEESEEESEEDDSKEESEEYTTVDTSRRSRDEDDERAVIPDSQSMDDDEEEMEDESDSLEQQPSYAKTSTSRRLQPSNRQTYKFGPLSLHGAKPPARLPGVNQTRLDNIRSINTTSTARLATSTSGSRNPTTTSRNPNPSSQPAPVLRTVMTSKMPSAMVARLARRIREEEREREREMMTSSDDDLDLLGGVERERAALAARQYGTGSGAGRRESSSRETERWSTP